MSNMSYMWQDFNIKTFPAETIVYRDGVFCSELSTIQSGEIDKNYDLPIHLIYIGEIAGKNELNINIPVDNQPIFLTVKIKNKKPAFLNIFIKNTGKNSVLKGKVLLFNESELNFDIFAGHFNENTGILIDTKLLANEKSVSKLSGTADIKYKNCDSDINFSALSGKDAKITFIPIQKITAIPKSAKHGASLFEAKDIQIQYLRENGLSGNEVQEVLKESFINNDTLF